MDVIQAIMTTFKDISYHSDLAHQKQKIDVYVPEGSSLYPVLVMIDAGNRCEDSDHCYETIGRNLAAKHLVSVIVQYTSVKSARYDDLMEDTAQLVAWIQNHIAEYKGLKDQIFLCGHGAGGHLAALLSLNKKILGESLIRQCIRGCLLIDAFGLTMDYVLQHHIIFFIRKLRKVFTEVSEEWIDTSPVHFIGQTQVPFLLLTGENTYPYLTLDNGIFSANLDRYHVYNEHHTLVSKNHQEMLSFLTNDNDEAYRFILEFIWKR